MYYVSKAMSVSTICPSIMGSVILALSIDYSLFLLSRFREELLTASRRTGAIDGGTRILTNDLSQNIRTVFFLGLKL